MSGGVCISEIHDPTRKAQELIQLFEAFVSAGGQNGAVGHTCSTDCRWIHNGSDQFACLASGTYHVCGVGCRSIMVCPQTRMIMCRTTGRVIGAPHVTSFDEQCMSSVDRQTRVPSGSREPTTKHTIDQRVRAISTHVRNLIEMACGSGTLVACPSSILRLIVDVCLATWEMAISVERSRIRKQPRLDEHCWTITAHMTQPGSTTTSIPFLRQIRWFVDHPFSYPNIGPSKFNLQGTLTRAATDFRMTVSVADKRAVEQCERKLERVYAEYKRSQ